MNKQMRNAGLRVMTAYATGQPKTLDELYHDAIACEAIDAADYIFAKMMNISLDSVEGRVRIGV